MLSGPEQQEERMQRLRWACRRTLRELDIPLGNFLQEHYLQLNMPQRFAFERLLSAADQDILDWLKGRRLPRDQGVLDILKLIRTAPSP